MQHSPFSKSFFVACMAAAALALVVAPSCSDPVRDRQIEELGPEDPEGPSRDHRRGQPCLLCHDEQGGEKPLMIAAGTVFKDQSPGADGAEDVEIEFLDAKNGAPFQPPITTKSGNFFVEKAVWPGMVFPFKVRIKAPGNTVPMLSTVNREGSCNFCHRPNPPEPYSETDREKARRSTGQIYVSATK